jgi:hypothetical protein
VTHFDAFLEQLDVYSVKWTLACRETQHVSLLLLHKAATRIRGFLLERIETLTKARTNVQIMQRSLVNHADLFTFLRRRVAGERSIGGGARQLPDVANEVLSIYCDLMRKLYQYYFFTYRCDLAKLQTMESLATAADTLAAAQRRTSSGGR